MPEPGDEFEALLRGMDPAAAQRIRDTREGIIRGLTETAEAEVIGSWKLGGTVLFEVGLAFDGQMEHLARELPFTWSRELPTVNALRVRPRLLRLHRRAKTRRWARRHGLLYEYVAIKYGMRFNRPLTRLVNTVTIR